MSISFLIAAEHNKISFVLQLYNENRFKHINFSWKTNFIQFINFDLIIYNISKKINIKQKM